MPLETTPRRSDAPAILLRVRWNSRVAGFEKSGIEELVEKARRHFRLVNAEEEFVLVTSIAGEKVEVTDDVLKHISGTSVLILEKLPKCNDSDDGCDGTSTSTESSLDSKATATVSRRPPPPPGPPSPPPPPPPGALPNAVTVGAPVNASQAVRGPQLAPLPLHSASPKLRKPVIYLMPPKPLANATVSVRLVPQWTFTHIYPVQKLLDHLDDGGQTVTWAISAHPDGSLVEKGSGLELSYLFWEAAALPGAPPSPPLDPVNHCAVAGTDDIERFDPTNPTLAPDTPTAVLLPFANLLPYLDRTLKTLALHTTARNDFITYWLPAFSKHPYVALRFLPQRAYERAAELEVVPTPDVVTRVMMLFSGISTSEVGNWTAAQERVSKVDWASVVGVGIEAFDATRFRVLEWGGMEIV